MLKELPQRGRGGDLSTGQRGRGGGSEHRTVGKGRGYEHRTVVRVPADVRTKSSVFYAAIFWIKRILVKIKLSEMIDKSLG